MKREKNKKKQGLDSEGYKKAIRTLAQLGAKEKEIKQLADIYQTSREKRKTKVAPDTFIIKTAEIAEYLIKERNVEPDYSSKRFTLPEVIELLTDNPELYTRDVNSEIKKKLDILDQSVWGSIDKTNSIIKTNGKTIFKTSNDKLQQINAVLEGLQIEAYGIRENLAEFCFRETPHQLKNSPKKLYFRLHFMQARGDIQNRCMTKLNFERAMKAKDVFEKRYGVTDETLGEMYPLPKFDPQYPEEFKKQVMESWTVKEKQEGDRED